MRPHAQRLELGDEVLLPVEDVRDLVREAVAIAGPGVLDQQTLGAARPEPLDEPEDANASQAFVRAVRSARRARSPRRRWAHPHASIVSTGHAALRTSTTMRS